MLFDGRRTSLAVSNALDSKQYFTSSQLASAIDEVTESHQSEQPSFSIQAHGLPTDQGIFLTLKSFDMAARFHLGKDRDEGVRIGRRQGRRIVSCNVDSPDGDQLPKVGFEADFVVPELHLAMSKSVITSCLGITLTAPVSSTITSFQHPFFFGCLAGEAD